MHEFKSFLRLGVNYYSFTDKDLFLTQLIALPKRKTSLQPHPASQIQGNNGNGRLVSSNFRTRETIFAPPFATDLKGVIFLGFESHMSLQHMLEPFLLIFLEALVSILRTKMASLRHTLHRLHIFEFWFTRRYNNSLFLSLLCMSGRPSGKQVARRKNLFYITTSFNFSN